jgi:hypothetical protein
MTTSKPSFTHFSTRGKYGAIYADPPWSFRNWSAKGKGRNAVSHYDCLDNLIIRREHELHTRIVATAPPKPSVQTRLAARTTSNMVEIEIDSIDELDPLDALNWERDDAA